MTAETIFYLVIILGPIVGALLKGRWIMAALVAFSIWVVVAGVNAGWLLWLGTTLAVLMARNLRRQVPAHD